MKAIEQGLDLGMGLLIISLSASTALGGLVSYLRTDLYRGIQDKNTSNIEGTLLPSDNIPDRSLEDLALTLTASIQNSDNVRQLQIVIKAKNDDTAHILEEDQSLNSNFEDTKAMLTTCMLSYNAIDTFYGQRLLAGHYQAFVTTDQSSITCYFLIE